MLNIETVKSDISKWIIETLSEAHPAFEGMPPCPFAKRALMEEKIEIILADEVTDFENTEALLAQGNDVIAYVYDPEEINPEELTGLALAYNKQYPDLVFLEDHPAEVEKVQDFICNQGQYACIFGAMRSGVLNAREYLKGTDYYKNWDEKYKQTVWSR